uniref:Uncharacterized protein n=1 Tax=Molossus molossus TaxID=27622 RepID=A0A7J8BYD9_MOLMO|nr:hypothetical protein HJG59_010033 [Molossus molossus]
MSEREMRSETRSLDLGRRWLLKRTVSEPGQHNFLTSYSLSQLPHFGTRLLFGLFFHNCCILFLPMDSVLSPPPPPAQCVHAHCENVLSLSAPLYLPARGGWAAFSAPPGMRGAAFSAPPYLLARGGQPSLSRHRRRCASKCSGQVPPGHPAPLSHSPSVNPEIVRPSCSPLLPAAPSAPWPLPGLSQQPLPWGPLPDFFRLFSAPQPESPPRMAIGSPHSSAQKPPATGLPFR